MKNFFRNYQKLIQSNEFIVFEKKLSHSLDIELSKDLKEVETVKNWITKINGKNFNHDGLNISINSLFIHGYNHSEKGSHPSGVEFDFYNKKENREFADIIFISSFYYRNRKVLEKITFNQAKWGEIKSTTSSWKIDQGQLYLLSRLPRFNGINGSFIPNKDYYIDNISKCLTSYGLMNKENFVFISTNYLLTVMAGKKSVNLKDFQSLNTLEHNANFPILDDSVFYYKFFHYLERYCERNCCCLNIFKKLLGASSTYFANNTFEFVSEYLKGNIGEIIHNDITETINSSASLLMQDIIQNIKTFSHKQQNSEAMQFIQNYDDSDNIKINDNIEFKEPESGLGIIQAKVKLGE
jgi:hypothetical protein